MRDPEQKRGGKFQTKRSSLNQNNSLKNVIKNDFVKAQTKRPIRASVSKKYGSNHSQNSSVNRQANPRA